MVSFEEKYNSDYEYIKDFRSKKINFSNFKYSKNVSEHSLILINLHLIEKEISPNVFSHFIHAFGFAKCISKYNNNDTTTLILYEKKRNLYIVGNITTIANGCPWTWANKCEWNSFHVSFMISSKIVEDISDVTIYNFHTSVKLDVTIKRTLNHEKKKDNLTICVPPLYWYDNFLQLFIFTEIWKLHGASHFVYYYYSVSEDVMNLLKYYESKNILTIVPLKSLPKSKMVDPNRSIYRYGHLAAINDCLQKRNSRYATVIDVDEFLYFNDSLYSNKKNFYQHIDEIFLRNKELSGLLFSHHGLRIDTKNMKEDFKFLQNSYLNTYTGPKKYIIKPNRVDTVDSHRPLKHMNYTLKRMDFNDAFLLHSRSNWANKNSKLDKKVKLISLDQTRKISDQFSKIRKKLNFIKDFDFQTNTLNIMNKCLSSWKKEGCKVPDDLCQKELSNVENWIKSDDIDTNEHYYIL
uniref:Glycosyltransferase family 92 protein n=1 Tax=Strongyloides papillosus TaxID=174720 RepID=A0A0N5B578_STREA